MLLKTLLPYPLCAALLLTSIPSPLLPQAYGQSGTALPPAAVGSEAPEQPGQNPADESSQGAPDEANCTYFGAQRERFLASRLGGVRRSRTSEEYAEVPAQLGRVGLPASASSSGAATGSRINVTAAATSNNLVDRNIFSVLVERGISPARKTTDVEFLRRVTLDLTGRVPTPAKVAEFLADASEGKRAKLVEELLASPAYVDKWTMFFGDLLRNTDRINATGIQRFQNGREAFYNWIKDSVASNKPYNRMAYELIAAEGENSWQKGELNWQVGNRVTNGPVQDTYDQAAAATADTFLGMSHFNCIMCHNGRGHVDELTLWGRQATRRQAYAFAAFFSQTNYTTTQPDAAQPNQRYYNLLHNPRGAYNLNTTTGNRPPRTPIGTERVVAPEYLFGAGTPNQGESWRAAAARYVTTDFQFARASVNYLWKELMGKGLVDPPNQMDPARLDPDNPPPAPWALQPSNARLLKELAEYFVKEKYDLKQVLRLIVNSDAYQLSSVYEGTWNPQWENLHARKLVRRLYGEEIWDAIVQTSNVPNPLSFSIDSLDRTKTRTVAWAMQTPSPQARGGAAGWLLTFYAGDREETERRREGSDQQALALMNNNFVVARTKATGTGPTASLLRQLGNQTDNTFVDNLFLNVLSRLPNAAEKEAALQALASGNKSQAQENLLWTLYNKVDFFFNY